MNFVFCFLFNDFFSKVHRTLHAGNFGVGCSYWMAGGRPDSDQMPVSSLWSQRQWRWLSKESVLTPSRPHSLSGALVVYMHPYIEWSECRVQIKLIRWKRRCVVPMPSTAGFWSGGNILGGNKQNGCRRTRKLFVKYPDPHSIGQVETTALWSLDCRQPAGIRDFQSFLRRRNKVINPRFIKFEKSLL